MSAELRALAAGVRRLIEATVANAAPAAVLATATRAVEHAVAALAPHVPTPRPPRYPSAASFDALGEVMPYDPIMGVMSPLAPPIEFAVVEGRAIGTVRFGTPYEGPPGCVHGGVIALAFDQVLNVANLTAGVPGPTKRLSLRFRRPTPLDAELRFEGWVAHQDEREVVSQGRLLRDGAVTVEAEGVFARLTTERIMRLIDPV